jgi:hypothetical protein
MMGMLALAVALIPVVAPDMAMARRGGDDGNRSEFYGIVEERPENSLRGTWIIGGRAFTADAGTEFDQSEGPLTVGSCAKVEVRNGRVHEIDSEPMRDCR